MPVGTFVRLGCGRIPPAEALSQISIDGDQELGERLIANGAYTVWRRKSGLQGAGGVLE